jgi:hypothetical protein
MHTYIIYAYIYAAAKDLDSLVASSREALGRAYLCSEIGRVGESKVFEKLLAKSAQGRASSQHDMIALADDMQVRVDCLS